MFVVGAIYLVGPGLPLRRTWARISVFAAVGLIVVRYLDWRLFTTVLPAEGAAFEILWVWFCFAVELLALGDALILYLTFLRTTDRHAEADHFEAHLRGQQPEGLPSVDVYITTYNEPFEVLEKTITGALSLDYPNFQLWVLDDGRRPWLKEFCALKGAGYITRPDNAHAKAGNINHALSKTSSEYFAIFDADFIVQRNFLLRTIGFFSDRRVGIVQVPHAFYNHDPMQTNLALRKTLPDDQRFFFEAIMPSRDGWDAAFCCGSNSVTRRAALRTIGDRIPTQSITEDMLLSLMLLRRGYVTRYVCERLAFGLAPEGLKAFFIQRKRWARGAIQILYLPEGPFGSDLSIMQRLLFLPTHWLSQSLSLLMTIIAPLMFLWFGLLPLVNVTADSIVYYLLPMILAVVGGIWVFAPRQYFPFAAQVLGTFQSFKILPAVLTTIVSPFGHAFNVTPKGQDARQPDYERAVFWTAATLMSLTAGGIIINTLPEWRIIGEGGLVPVVAGWAGLNVVILFLVCMMSLQVVPRRGEERFTTNEPVWIDGPNGARSMGRTIDISLSGARIQSNMEGQPGLRAGDALRMFVAEVGYISGRIVRQNGQTSAIRFDLPPSVERDLLVRKLFTSGIDATNVVATAWSATGALLQSIWSTRSGFADHAQDEGLVARMVFPTEKLPALSLVIPPHFEQRRLASLVAARRAA